MSYTETLVIPVIPGVGPFGILIAAAVMENRMMSFKVENKKYQFQLLKFIEKVKIKKK